MKCHNGHPRTKENTYVFPSGKRQCRVCIRAAKKRHREKEQRKYLASLLAVGLSACTSGTPTAPKFSERLCWGAGAEPMQGTIKVLTANIQNRVEPYQERMSRLRNVVHDLEPDLVSFQESAPGQVRELLPEGFHLAEEGTGTPYDVAIASRWSIGTKITRRLPGTGKVLAVEILTPGHCMVFVSTVGDDRWQRKHELRRELDAVALDAFIRETVRPETPVIIGGDFDAQPHYASIRFLTGKQSLEGRSTYWQDVWESRGEGLGVTYSESMGGSKVFIWTYRIDYIFTRENARVLSARVVEEIPSDHRGVFAEVKL